MAFRDWILVGVDGSAGSTAAVRYAAQEASRRDLGLRLVHVTPMFVPLAPRFPRFYELTTTQLENTGRKILEDAAAQARSLVAASRITTALLDGDRVTTLVAESARALMVVMGDAKLPFLERLVTGSTADGVAARALSLVTLVGADWKGRGGGPVVAGIRSARHSEILVQVALEEARSRKAPLLLVHAWDVPGLAEEELGEAHEREAWITEEHRTMEEALGPVLESYPDVDVGIQVIHGNAGAVLRAASREADLLVLARREHPLPEGYLGATGRTLLHASTCPVQVVPPVPPPGQSLDSIIAT